MRRRVRQLERGVRRDDENAVGRKAHPVLYRYDGHGGEPSEELVESTFVVRSEVLDDHERHAGVGRHTLEQVCERLEPAGGRADPDDKRGLAGIGGSIAPRGLAW